MSRDEVIQLTNSSAKDVAVKIKASPRTVSTATSEQQVINFTLANTSGKSIPLIIPGVMNPNLSPFSKSGVNLEIGQEILFREKGKNHILLTVDNSIEDGQKIDVPKLMKERRSELGLDG